jgi:hypothetical protein
MKSKFSLLSLSLLLLTMLFLGYLTMRPADLREGNLLYSGISQQLEQNGREILALMAKAHGSENYHSQPTQSFRFRNTWETLPGAVYRPWVENGQDIEMICTTGVHLRAETEFLSGSNAGEVWGVKDKHAYTRQSRGATPAYKRNPNTELWLSTFQFLFELPFRTAYYPIVADMGMDDIEGRSYRKIFITWEEERPSKAFDQLVFWINPDSYVLEKAHYTCRDSGFGFFTATIHYRDYAERDGFLAAQSADITFGGPKDKYFGQYIGLHHIEMLPEPQQEAAKL